MVWSRRATVLGETAMPSLASSSAMVVVVRRDRRSWDRPRYRVRAGNGERRLGLAFFFRRSTTTTGAARSAADHILIQQLLPTPGYGMYIQAQEIAEPSVPAVAQADGLQAGKQAALLFIEQAIEEEDGGLEFMGRRLEVGGMDGYRDGLSAAPGEHLFGAKDRFDGGIEKLALDLHSRQALLLDQMAERLLHFGVQGVGQFMGVISVRSLVDEGF